MRETRAFATWLEAARRGGRPADLCTVTWFTLEGELSLGALTLVAVEANLWLGGSGGGGAMRSPVTVRHAGDAIDPAPLVDEAGRCHAACGDILHLTVVVPATVAPLLVILTVDNLACDASSLTLLVERMSERYLSLEAGGKPHAAGPAPVPEYGDLIAPELSAERIEAHRARLHDLAWLNRGHLCALDTLGDDLEGSEACEPGLVTVQLPADQARALMRLKTDLSATPFMIALAGWAGLLAEATGAERVAVLINTTARQLEGCEGELGFFYDLGVLPMEVEASASGRELVAAARRAVIDHHLGYVPSLVLCEQIGDFRQALADPATLLLAIQSKRSDAAAGMFAGRRRSALQSIMSGGESFSLPLDGLVTLASDGDGVALMLEYRPRSIPAEAARALMTRYRTRLAALIADPDADRPSLARESVPPAG